SGEIPGVLDQGQGCSGARASTVTVEWTKRADRKVYNIVHLKYVSCGDIAELIQQSCCFAVSRAQRLIQEMLRTVEEAMSQAINWWGDVPPPMKEAIEQFRTQLGAAIDSVEFVKKALDRRVPEPGEKATEQR